MASRSAKIAGVVLDVDGTLVDSNDHHARAWCDALTAQGFPARFEVVRKLIGMGGDKLVPRMTGLREDSREGKRLGKLRGEVFRERYLPRVRPFRGSRAMVEALLDHGVEVAIATSAEPRERDALLEVAGVADLLARDKKRTDAERSKPDPDAVHAALAKLRVPVRRAVMVGDTPYDVEAAALAGIRTIAFRCGGWDDADLAGAIAIHDGPWSLAAALRAAPSFSIEAIRAPRARAVAKQSSR